MSSDGIQRLHNSDFDHMSYELISAYLDDECTAEERLAVHRHLPICDACGTRLEDQREVVALLKALPAVPAPRSSALVAKAANPALSWFRWMRLASAFATFAFVAIFAFNFAYISVPLGPTEVVLRTPLASSAQELPKDSPDARIAASIQSAPAAKSNIESASPREAGPSVQAEMASMMFEVEAVPSISPFAGYEWPVLAATAVLAISTLGLWLRVRR